MRMLKIVAVLACAAGIGGFTLTEDSVETSYSLPFGPTDCNKCVKCGPNDQGHKVETGGGPLTATAHTCEERDPCDHHSVCEDALAFEEMDAIRRAVQTENVHLVARKLKEHPAQFVYNAARRALQLIGCDGKVVAHFPWAEGLLGD